MKLLRASAVSVSLALVLAACNGGDSGSPPAPSGTTGGGGASGATGSAGTSAGGATAGGPSAGGTSAGGASGGTSAGTSFGVLLNVVDFDADDQSLYLLDRGLGESDGKLARRSIAGSSLDELASTEGEPRVLRLRGSTVYWLARSASSMWSDSSKKWAIRSLPKDAAAGATPTTLVDGITGGNSPGEFAVDDAYVYWVELSSFALWRAPVGGGARTAWYGMGTNDVSYDTRNIRLDATSVYYTDGPGSMGAVQVWAVDKDGTHHRKLADGVNVVRELFLDDTNVYWVDGTDGNTSYGGHLWRAPKDGSAPAAEVGSFASHVGAAGVAAGGKLWMSSHDGTSTDGDVVASLPSAGGASSIVLSGLSSPHPLRANATTLFVPSHGAGTTFQVLPL